MVSPFLQQIGAKADASRKRDDWRPATNPIWGTTYFVNKWDSSPEYDLQRRRVPQTEVRFSFVAGGLLTIAGFSRTIPSRYFGKPY